MTPQHSQEGLLARLEACANDFEELSDDHSIIFKEAATATRAQQKQIDEIKALIADARKNWRVGGGVLIEIESLFKEETNA